MTELTVQINVRKFVQKESLVFTATYQATPITDGDNTYVVPTSAVPTSA